MNRGKSEYNNMTLSLLIYVVMLLLSLFLVSELADDFDFGRKEASMGSIICAIECIVMAACYGLWYTKVNREIREFINVGDKKQAALKYRAVYFGLSLMLCAGLTVAGFLLTFLTIGELGLYSGLCSAIVGGIGNILLFVLTTTTFGQPNRMGTL